jgi:hypothetical protein
MEAQSEALETAMSDWKANEEQIDDMLVVGFIV